MDTLLKLLIATACICVIAVSGHYGYSVYQSHMAAKRQIETLRTEATIAIERAKERAQRLIEDEDKRKEAERARRKDEREQKRKAFLERVEARKAERAAEERKKQQASD